MIDGSEKRNGWLNLELQSPHVIESCSNCQTLTNGDHDSSFLYRSIITEQQIFFISFYTMKGGSNVNLYKCLLCLVCVVVLIVWQLRVIFFSHMRNNRPMGNRMTKRWVIIFWSTVFGKPAHIHLDGDKDGCPVPCELTTNHSRESEASGFIVHARDGHMTPPTDAVPWILFTRENPVYTPVLSNQEFMSKFKLLESYRLDSDFPQPVYTMPNLTPPIPFKEKTGLIMVAISNCEPVRTEYMRQLMQFVQIDSYGGCLKNKNDLVARYGSANGKDFKQIKTDLERKYKFTLVFFNQDCDYFVDDQLSHAFDAGSVPVVMATDKLEEFLPGNLKNAVIKVRNFQSPKVLAEYLKNLSTNEAEYNKYLEWKWKGIGNITGTVIGDYWNPKYPIYCQICIALSEGRVHREGLKADNCKPRAFEDWGIVPGVK